MPLEDNGKISSVRKLWKEERMDREGGKLIQGKDTQVVKGLFTHKLYSEESI